MFITEINTKFIAGNGGNGKVSFLSLEEVQMAAMVVMAEVFILLLLRIFMLLTIWLKILKLKLKMVKMGWLIKNGRNADDLEIKLPIGTVVKDKETKEIFEIINKDDRFKLCNGGSGGLGNFEYRSSSKTTPLYAQNGLKGQRRDLEINLKLIADYGLIGFPNAGKSSLLRELTSAKPKIDNYPFTTLEPNLGELDGKIIADIPGLIKGASRGKGLGIKFLKHIERVYLLLHCISCENNDLIKSYRTIRNELKEFNPKLMNKQEIILLTKTDLKSKKEIDSSLNVLREIKKQTLPVSINDWDSLEKLKTTISLFGLKS